MLPYENDLKNQLGKVLLAEVNAASVHALVFGGPNLYGGTADGNVKSSFTVLDIDIGHEAGDEVIEVCKNYTIRDIAELCEHEREAFASAGICALTEIAEYQQQRVRRNEADELTYKRELFQRLKKELGES